MNAAQIIPAAHVDQHAIHPAVWQQAVPAPADTPAGLLRQLHELGTVARLDLITAALEAARRDGAARALEALAPDLDAYGQPGLARMVEHRAERARAGQL